MSATVRSTITPRSTGGGRATEAIAPVDSLQRRRSASEGYFAIVPIPCNIFYCDSGPVSVEIAVMAPILARPENTSSPRSGYHGDTWNMHVVCDPVTVCHSIFEVHAPLCSRLPLPIRRRRIACIAPLRKHGSSGTYPRAVHRKPAAWFLSPAMLKEAAAMRHYMLLIFDEITAGQPASIR